MMNESLKRITLYMSLAMTAVALIGCGTSAPGSGGTQPINPVSLKILGKVHSGTQPLVGATVQLYAVGNTGLKSASTPLITQVLQTAADGTFDITNGWNCVNTGLYGNDPLIYIVATGGGIGAGSSANNASSMMTALGRCSTVTAASFIYINEVTTVASAYALAPFTLDGKHIGASSSNMPGLATAFASVASLVDTSTGVSPGPALVAGASVPSSKINTLANVVATCVNATSSSACATLFAATSPSGGAAATDTLASLLQIAQSPLHNVASIYSLNTSSAPFQPSLASSPTDWSIAIQFKGGGLSSPSGIALDAAGNAWIANSGGNTVTEIGNQGTFITGSAGYAGDGKIIGAQAIAVDKKGNVWLADTLLSSVVKLTTTSGGTIQSSNNFLTGINGPTSLAIDPQNRVWVANFGDGSIAELDNSGLPVGGSPLVIPSAVQRPFGIAIDGTGNAWVTDNAASVVAKFDTHQTLLSATGFTDNALFAPQGLAIDSLGRTWIAGTGSNSATLLQPDGTASPTSPYLGGVLAQPSSLAIDGAGTVWLTNGTTSGSLSQIQQGAATIGAIGALNTPESVAIDASGNIWTANSGDDTITKFIGLATPITTPLVNSLP